LRFWEGRSTLATWGGTRSEKKGKAPSRLGGSNDRDSSKKKKTNVNITRSQKREEKVAVHFSKEKGDGGGQGRSTTAKKKKRQETSFLLKEGAIASQEVSKEYVHAKATDG